MIDSLRITVLVENRSMDPLLSTEHGLALLIEADEVQILLDTGDQALTDNAQTLGLDFDQLDAVVLSHGHRDHSGGLAAVLRRNPALPVYLHPRAIQPRYSIRSGHQRSIGLPTACYQALGESDFRFCRGPQPLNADIWVTGEIDRRQFPADSDPGLSLSSTASIPDPVSDDMALVLRTKMGLVVVTGCCHAGINATLNTVSQQCPNDTIYAVVGGLHLRHSASDACAHQGQALKEWGVSQILAGHCTGPQAETMLYQHFGEAFSALWCGQRWCLRDEGFCRQGPAHGADCLQPCGEKQNHIQLSTSL